MRFPAPVPRTPLPSVAFLVLASALASCADGGRAAGLYAREAAYELGVDRAGVEVDADGALRFETALGYEVALDRAYLVQASVALVQCEGVGADAWDEAAAALRSLALPAVARANHGEEADPSRVAAPSVLDLVAGGDRAFGARSFAEQRYCRVHLLVAGFRQSLLAGGPLDRDLTGTALRLELRWRRAQGPERAWTPATLTTTSADGAIHDLPDVLESGAAGDAVRVRVEWHVASLLDGVDLGAAEQTPEELGRAALRNLARTATVRAWTW